MVSDQIPGQGSQARLCQPDAGGWHSSYPRAKQRRTPRAFAISEQLREASKPTKFIAVIKEESTYVKDVWTHRGMMPYYSIKHWRVWDGPAGSQLTDKDLKKYNWTQPNPLHAVFIGTIWKKTNNSGSASSN